MPPTLSRRALIGGPLLHYAPGTTGAQVSKSKHPVDRIVAGPDEYHLDLSNRLILIPAHRLEAEAQIVSRVY